MKQTNNHKINNKKKIVNDVAIYVKMPTSVKETLDIKAEAKGLNNSEFIRSLILENEVMIKNKNINCTRLKGLVGNLTGNINQISKNLNIANNQQYLNDIDYEHIINILEIILCDVQKALDDN